MAAGQYVPQLGAFTSLAALQAAFAAGSNPVGSQAYTEDYDSPTFNDGVRHRILDTGVIYAANYGIDPTGVADSAAAINLAIIDAINGKKKLVLPTGLFLLNSPLLCFTSINQTFQMYGQGGSAIASANGSPEVPSTQLAIANTILYTNYTNAPAIVTNSGRNMVLKDFAILGQNLAPITAAGTSTGPPVTQSSWITAGCQTGRYAPYCGIAFDPFSNSSAQTITGITAAASAVVTVSSTGSNPFTIGQAVVFASVVGMTQINGLSGTVTATGGTSGAFTATTSINSSGFTAYVSGGTAVGLPFSKATITGISVAASAVVTLNPGNAINPFQIGETVYFSGVSGMTQINGLTGTITALTMTYSSSCTITVNINSSGFSAYTSGGLATVADFYSSLVANYKAANNGDGTYGCVVENVNIFGFCVGAAIGCSGATALAADITFRNTNIQDCDVCYGIGNSQARNINIEYGNITDARTGFDGLNYGVGNGAPPQMLRPNFGFLYRIFACVQTIGSFQIIGGYAESINCLGQFGIGSSSGALPLTFVGGDYNFGGSGWTLCPLMLETWGPTTFIGVDMGFTAEVDAYNVTSPNQSPVLFDHCTFNGTSTANTAPQIGLTQATGTGYSKLVDCWTNGGVFSGTSFGISSEMGRTFNISEFVNSAGRLNTVYQTQEVWNGNVNKYRNLPLFTNPEISIFNCSAITLNSTTVTLTNNVGGSAAYLQVGDILFWQMVQQGYSLSKYKVPALKITGITGTSVTAALIFDPAQYDTAANQQSTTTVYLAPNHWAPTVALSCITAGGNATISNVSPATILQNGDYVAGVGITAGSRVVSGGGTATVVLSLGAAATSTALTITGISQAASAVVTLSTAGSANPVQVGQQIVFLTVSGMTQINSLTGTVTAIGGSSGAWMFTVNIASTGFSAYTSGGTATIASQLYFDQLQAPVMQPAFFTPVVDGAIGAYVAGGIASAAAVSLTTATPANVTSISLTAGDWDVYGTVDYTPGATTSISILQQGISTTTGAFAEADTYTMQSMAAEVPGANQIANPTPVVRLNLTATTTVYLVTSATFTLSTLAAYGRIRARRCA
jgi:hypothetical protein